jgi:hypothetical protein
VTLVAEKWLENSRKVCEIIHKWKLSYGGEPVARHAQAKISTKCRRKCLEEQRKVEERQAREGE